MFDTTSSSTTRPRPAEQTGGTREERKRDEATMTQQRALHEDGLCPRNCPFCNDRV